MDPIARCFNTQCTAHQISETLLKLSGKTKHWYSEKKYHNGIMDWYCRQFLRNFSPISHLLNSKVTQKTTQNKNAYFYQPAEFSAYDASNQTTYCECNTQTKCS